MNTLAMARRFILGIVLGLLALLLFVHSTTAFSEGSIINCRVTILTGVTGVKLRLTRTLDDNSWIFIINTRADGTMVVGTAKTYDSTIWPQGTVIQSITATRMVSDSSGHGYTWVQVTVTDSNGDTLPQVAYLAVSAPGTKFLKLECTTPEAPTAQFTSAATSASAATGSATAEFPTVTPTALITPTLVMAPDQIFYVSCLKDGVGPDVDVRPVSITNAKTGKLSSIPAGSWVVRIVDETGVAVPPDDRGRVLILWNNDQWLIVQTVLKQQDADGSTDCDGHITPMPTLTPVSSEEATSATLEATSNAPQETDFGTFGKLAYTMAPIFGTETAVAMTQPAADGTINLLPKSIADCLNQKSETDVVSGKCDPDTSDTLRVYSPVAGCLYHTANSSEVVIVVSPSGIGCKDAIKYPRLEIVLDHLDSRSVSGITTRLIQTVKPGELIGKLCSPETAAVNTTLCASSLPYLKLQFRRNQTYKDEQPADKDQLYTLLPDLIR